MNIQMINIWNNIVKINDIVIYLGDFGFGKKENLKEICDKLNGHKILVKGNHDRKQSNGGLKFIGFEDIFDSLRLDNILLTHKPVIEVEKGIVNVHGHIHNANTSLIDGYKAKNHLCVSVECTNYMPVSVDYIKKKFKSILH